jgi:hypothetical protein
MPSWTGLAFAGFGLVGVGIGSAVWIGSSTWNGVTGSTVETLLARAADTTVTHVDFTELNELPAPVAKYFRRVLSDGQPFIRSTRMTQTGMFLAKESEDGWRPFEATQVFSANPPGFVWDARIHMAPLTTARVRDSYVSGKGSTDSACR